MNWPACLMFSFTWLDICSYISCYYIDIFIGLSKVLSHIYWNSLQCFIRITGGIKDLKIYADLALLSVEGDEHVGRVTKLHSAAIGYSSVIFGNIDGEDQMIDSWEEVWQNLKRDNFLPQNLVILLNRLRKTRGKKEIVKTYKIWLHSLTLCYLWI